MERKGARRNFLALTMCGRSGEAFAGARDGISVCHVAPIWESPLLFIAFNFRSSSVVVFHLKLSAGAKAYTR